MRTYKPTLFNAGQRARLRYDRFRILRVGNVPKRGSEVLPVLVNRKRVIAVQDMDTQPCLKVIERGATNARNITSR
jgi:hypothetical protein